MPGSHGLAIRFSIGHIFFGRFRVSPDEFAGLGGLVKHPAVSEGVMKDADRAVRGLVCLPIDDGSRLPNAL